MGQVPTLLEQMGTLLDKLQDAYDADMTEASAADTEKDRTIVNLQAEIDKQDRLVVNLQKQNAEMLKQKQHAEDQLKSLQTKFNQVQSLFSQ